MNYSVRVSRSNNGKKNFHRRASRVDIAKDGKIGICVPFLGSPNREHDSMREIRDEHMQQPPEHSTGREVFTHISTDSFKCQLCLLSSLLEFLSAVFSRLCWLERCMKLMLYHFFDFSNELSCGFAFFGLFSACGWLTEPSQFATSLFSISGDFPAQHSSSAGAVALSVSSMPAEAFACATSSPMFGNFFWNSSSASPFRSFSTFSGSLLASRVQPLTTHTTSQIILFTLDSFLAFLKTLIIIVHRFASHVNKYLSNWKRIRQLKRIFFIPQTNSIYFSSFDSDSNWNSIKQNRTVCTANFDRFTEVLTRYEFLLIFYACKQKLFILNRDNDRHTAFAPTAQLKLSRLRKQRSK